MRIKNRLLRKTTSIFLMISILVGLCTPVYADNSGSVSNNSSDIISTYINMAAGKSEFGQGAELAFTKNQLRFLGVYISNFFIPFGTEFGVARSEDTDKTMSQIKESLQGVLNFSDTNAKMISEELVGLARNSVKDLIFVGETDAGDLVQPTKYKIEGNYYNFIQTMFGNASLLINEMEGGELRDKLNSGELKKGYWGYKDGDKFKPMFDFNISSSENTPSQIAFNKCLSSVKTDMGYGFNMFDITEGSERDKFEDSNISDDTALKISMLGMDMKVDCFGDILVCGMQHQFVAVPGAMNPFTWVTVDNSGADLLKPGQSYNIINVPSMSLADSNQLVKYSAPADINSGSGGNGSNGNENMLGKYTMVSKSTLNVKEQVFFILSSKGAEESNPGSKEKMEDALEYVLSYIDGKADNLSEYNVSITKSKVIVEAPVGSLATLNSSKITDNFNYKDESKYKKFQKSLKTITGGIALNLGSDSSNCYLSKKTLKRGIQSVANSANKDKNSGEVNQDTNINTGSTSVLCKQFTQVWTNNFSEYFTLYRGTAETNFDSSLNPFSGGNTTKMFENMIEQYKQMYPYDKSINLLKKDKFVWSNKAKAPICSLTGTQTYMNDVIVFIDNLGDFHFDNSSSVIEDYSTFPVINYITENSTTVNEEAKVAYTFGSSDVFSAGFDELVDGKLADSSCISEPLAASLYVTYCMSSLYGSNSSDKANTIGKIGFRMNSDNMVSIPNEPLNLSDNVKSDFVLASIRDWLYYLLHPTDGPEYFKELITNKLNALLVGWHNDMLGTNGVGHTLGTTKYRNTMGYVTTPDLSEIEWTDSLIDFYNDCIPFLLIVMIVTMILAYVTGILPIQRSIFGVIIFAIFLLIPVNLINGVVGYSNRISENIYGEKFTYWALMQMESYASAIDEAAQGNSNAGSGEQGSYVNYLTTLYNKNSEVYTNQGNESIVLKWQAPKKMTSLMYKSDNSYKGLTSEGKDMLNMFLGTTMTGQSFIDDPESVYLYRSYVDISNYARYVYNGIKNGTQPSKRDLSNDITSNWNSSLYDAIQNMDANYLSDRHNGYVSPDDTGDSGNSSIKLKVPMSSSIVNDALAKKGTIKEMGINDMVGINPLMFNIGIPAFNKDLDLLNELKNEAGDGEARVNLENELSSYSEEDVVGLLAYALYSENVFYYFSWDLYDLGLEPSSATNSGYKDLLLGEDGAGFFYNKIGNGELKDFMDMKSLFTYIIPYLKQANDLVREWDSVYGVFLYDGIPFEDGHWEDEAIKSSKEMQQKYWHNLNVNRLYSMYTPWVDIMYNCSYAEGEYISAMGNKYFVTDPLNPSAYPEERPMIFSETEMQDYGLGRGGLTKVERLILNCNKGMEERMYDLLNYFNFSDVTLNTAAAMNCAFEFNSTFSENGIFSDNRNIYPQSFELSDFSYDAFLRFILSNTTGESMTAEGDFYANIVKNSSTTTISVMLILDVISMYVLPAFKIFFLIGVFLLSILIVLVSAFRVDPEQKFIKKVLFSIVNPMFKFLISTIGFAYTVSLFMGTGNNAVTQSKQISIDMGSPVTVMICMIALNCLILFIYFKIIKGIVKDICKQSKLAVNFVQGVFGSVAGMIGGAFSKVSNSVSGSSGNSNSGGGNVSTEGTGRSSDRAERRGSSVNTSYYNDRISSTRTNDTKRDTVKFDYKDNAMEESKKRTEDLNKKTSEGIANFNYVKDDVPNSKRNTMSNKSVNELGSERKGNVDK